MKVNHSVSIGGPLAPGLPLSQSEAMAARTQWWLACDSIFGGAPGHDPSTTKLWVYQTFSNMMDLQPYRWVNCMKYDMKYMLGSIHVRNMYFATWKEGECSDCSAWLQVAMVYEMDVHLCPWHADLLWVGGFNCRFPNWLAHYKGNLLWMIAGVKQNECIYIYICFTCINDIYIFLFERPTPPALEKTVKTLSEEHPQDRKHIWWKKLSAVWSR